MDVVIKRTKRNHLRLTVLLRSGGLLSQLTLKRMSVTLEIPKLGRFGLILGGGGTRKGQFNMEVTQSILFGFVPFRGLCLCFKKWSPL